LAKCNSTTEPVGAISPACGSVLEDRADGCGVRRSDERSVAAYAVCRLTSGTLATIQRRRRDPGGRRPRAADAARPDKHAEHRPRLGAQGDSRRPGSGGRHHARQRVHGQLQRLRRVEDRERVPAVPDRPVSIPGADPAQPAGLAFTVYVVPSDEPVGKVVAQEPNSGTAVAVGLAVRFNTFRAADDGLLEQRVVRGFTRGNRIAPNYRPAVIRPSTNARMNPWSAGNCPTTPAEITIAAAICVPSAAPVDRLTAVVAANADVRPWSTLRTPGRFPARRARSRWPLRVRRRRPLCGRRCVRRARRQPNRRRRSHPEEGRDRSAYMSGQGRSRTPREALRSEVRRCLR
jgi:hypothetical protein